MKKFKFRMLVAVCLAVALLGGTLTVFTLAQTNVPTVTYDHAETSFSFDNVEPAPGNEYPNLFPEFAGMMPGDSTTQDVRVQVDNVHGGTVYMYLRTELAWEDKAQEISEEEAAAYAKAMETLTLEVKQGDKVLSETALGEGVLLGKLRDDDSVDLTVSLQIPLEAGNELQGLAGEIGWVFTAEYHEDYYYGGGSGVPAEKPALNKGDHYAYIVGYPDGLVHPELNITRAETATIFFRLLTDASREEFWSQANPYNDVMPDDWYNNAVSTLTNAGVLNGYPDGSFLPDDNITRAEFAALAVRFFDSDEADVEEDAFPDISKHWANAAINRAYAEGIIEGYPDGTYRPDQEITRAEAMTIVNRLFERYPHDDHLHEDMIVWPDNMDEDAWYYEAVQEATNSHAYQTKQFDDGTPYEIWEGLLPGRDWTALERQWSEYNSTRNPGEEVSSKDAAVFID